MDLQRRRLKLLDLSRPDSNLDERRAIVAVQLLPCAGAWVDGCPGSGLVGAVRAAGPERKDIRRRLLIPCSFCAVQAGEGGRKGESGGEWGGSKY